LYSSHANLLLSSNAFIVSHEMSDGRKLNLCRLPQALATVVAHAEPRQQQDKAWEARLLALPLCPGDSLLFLTHPDRSLQNLEHEKPAQLQCHLCEGLS